MLSPKKAKLAALKLSQLKKGDQRWVLEQLPEKFAEEVNAELSSLKSLGLENSSQLIKQVEDQALRQGLDKKLESLHTHFDRLSNVDKVLVLESLDPESQSAVCSDSNKYLDTTAKKLGRKAVVMTPKFKSLYMESVLSELEGAS